MAMNNWEKFFDSFAPKYKDEPYVHNTVAEVDFMISKFDLHPGMNILDVGCGTGRHSLEFARRGFAVTGIDLSENILQEAKKSAHDVGATIEFIKADATDFSLDKKYDLAICLCEGAFGLLGNEEEPFLRDVKILKNIHACLLENGHFFMTNLNGYRFIRQYNDVDVENGTFDNIHCVERFSMEDYSDTAKGITFLEKAFTPSELQLMLHLAGFVCEGFGGGTAGNWNDQKLLMDEMEVMVWAKKK